mmetsp:Transcript_159354/g.297209  ORF Transcript_159354/g.297209 Transcript_159354/m.297209 type:complete len:211 (-) Transcript_159354:150-782(-)
MLLTDAQVQDFKDTFARFDVDSSGTIEVKEIGFVLKSLGHEPSQELLEVIVKDIDPNGSGEIDFEEFCTLMGKTMGTDGKVDMDTYLKNVSIAASREARREAVLELVPVMSEQIKKSEGIIESEKSKLEGATQRMESLEGDHAQLVNEVQKLRKGLEVTQEYWKGFSRGLKETKKSVLRPEETCEQGPSGNRQTLPIVPLLSARQIDGRR